MFISKLQYINTLHLTLTSPAFVYNLICTKINFLMLNDCIVIPYFNMNVEINIYVNLMTYLIAFSNGNFYFFQFFIDNEREKNFVFNSYVCQC